jgi:hypothetical protein
MVLSIIIQDEFKNSEMHGKYTSCRRLEGALPEGKDAQVELGYYSEASSCPCSVPEAMVYQPLKQEALPIS